MPPVYALFHCEIVKLWMILWKSLDLPIFTGVLDVDRLAERSRGIFVFCRDVMAFCSDIVEFFDIWFELDILDRIGDFAVSVWMNWL